MNANQTAWSLLADGTLKAAILILTEKGIDPITADAEKLSTDLKAELTTRIPEVMKEWKDIIEAHMGEEMLRYTMNVQANHIALMALKNGGWF